MSITLTALQKQRRDTAANWTSANPTLLAGEIGLESDTGYWKVGDGSTAWTSLAYVSGLGAEIPVSRLADGSARQLLQTAANGTDVEWTSNVDVPGTLDVTSTATFDSIASHPLGSAAAPTLTFTGDPNTGIYSPGADQVAISTGGSGRLFVDASGRVGVGATPAAANFEASQSGTASASDVLRIYNRTDGTSTGYLGLPKFGSTASAYGPYSANNVGINAVFTQLNIGTETAHALVAYTNNQERLRITSGGLVGVGTSSPGEALDVAGKARILNNTGATNTGDQNVVVVGSTTSGAFSSTYGAGLQFQITNSSGGYSGSRIVSRLNADNNTANLVFQSRNYGFSDAMTLDSSGRLGIGTTSPNTALEIVNGKLQVNTGSSLGSAGSESINTYAATGSRIRFYDNSSSCSIGSVQNGANSELTFNVNGTTERVRIDGSGRVGIGNTAPGNFVGNVNLVVGSAATSTTNAGVTLYSGTATYGGVYFADGTVGDQLYRGAVEYKHDVDALTLYSGGSEKARIDSSGRLLVGTSSARDNFFNTTGVAPQIQLEGTAVGSRVLSIVSSDSTVTRGGALLLGHQKSGTIGGNTALGGTDSIGFITFQGSDGSEFVEGARIEAIIDGGVAANDLPTALVFSTTADGASSPTERMRIQSTGETNILATNTVFGSRTQAGAGTTDRLIFGVYGATSTTLTGTISFTVWTNGNVINTNNSYGSISDIKLKENIVDSTSQWDDIKALQVRKYNFKEGQTHTQIGLIAQEVELVSPGLVSESPDRDEDGNDLGTVTKSVNYSVLYMKAVKALQEAMERIEQLEAKVAALERA